MIDAEVFIREAAEKGFSIYSGVPCSYLKPFINHVIESDHLRYVGAANEGDAVAIAAGAELGGQRAIAMFQNSGLGNAVNPLTSLTFPFRIPILLITTYRGEPGGHADEPQHELMGRMTTHLLDLMEIRWEYFPENNADVGPAVERAANHMRSEQLPFAFVMRKGSVAPSKLSSRQEIKDCSPRFVNPATPSVSRQEMLRAIQAAAKENDVVVATTGYTGRELYACGDKANQLYFVGSMGCASSFGLGLAISNPHKRVIVIDGDGAALMRLGAMCTLGYERPTNLIHVLLDNGIHESTGGQATVSESVNFCSIASASGYSHASSISSPDEVRRVLSESNEGLTFVHVPILPGIPDELPRPSIQPVDVARRLRRTLGAG